MGCDALYDARLAIPGKDVVLFDLATWKNGLSFKKIDFSDSGIPVIKIAELNNGIGSSTSFTRGVYSSDVKLQRGDFLFSWSGNPETSIDIFRFELKEGWLNQHIFKTTPNSSLVTRDYFFYLMKWLKPVFKSIASNKQTTGLGHITISDLKKIKVTVPAKDLQNKVAAILTAIDNKISLNAKLNGYLEELANTAFADWLKKHANGKEIASFVSDSDHLSLGELCSKVTDGSHSSPRNDPNGKYPMLSVRDMRRFGFDYASCKMISQIDFDAMTANDCVPKVDDILVAKDGSYLKEVFITNEEKNEAVLSSIAIFRPDKRIIAPEILLYFLKHPRTRKLVADNFVSGSALPRIVLKDFKKLTLLTPSRKEQEEILPILQIVRNLTWANVKGNERLVKLRDTLLPKLMSGEIDVSKVDPTQLNSHLA